MIHVKHAFPKKNAPRYGEFLYAEEEYFKVKIINLIKIRVSNLQFAFSFWYYWCPMGSRPETIAPMLSRELLIGHVARTYSETLAVRFTIENINIQFLKQLVQEIIYKPYKIIVLNPLTRPTRRPLSDERFSPLETAIAYGPKLAFLVLLQTLLMIHRPDITDREHRVKPVIPSQIQDTYDFVIIGGGSAGAVMANRLSEIGNWTVLLLEAGPDEPPLADVPVSFMTLQNTPIDWQFRAEPSEEYCLAMNNNQCGWPRGKVLGGSSVLNAMLYIRGNKKDYDNWENLGNPGWNYETVLPYFKKSEDMRIPEYQNSKYHQTGGYLTVEYFKHRFPVCNNVLSAGVEMGYEVLDVNGAKQTGFTFSHGTVRDGLRCSTAKAFLRPVSKRKNLDISLKTNVDKILIDEKTKTAYGVQFQVGTLKSKVKARREVILSAGAIQSPQLLMLSGIGPKNHLEEVSIPVIHDSPGVGENLQDHVAMGGLVYLIDPPPEYAQGVYVPLLSPPPFSFILEDVIVPETMKEFVIDRTGPLYSVVTAEAMSFINSKYANQSDDYPDIQIFWASGGESSDGGVTSTSFNIRQEVHDSMYGSIALQNSYQGIPLLMRPRSRGYIKLRSKDPDAYPFVVPNYFNDPRDLDIIIEGAKFIHKLTNTKPMKSINARPNPNKVPGCEDYEYGSDDYWRCHARHYSLTIYHPCGTCKMGPASDKMAVVDHRLRVHGIKRLRVVDASIMPRITNGNTNAPTIMIAEKAADMIKEDWGVRSADTRN
ncbi:glucose dehydrogenase [FAD, quinone]-like [Calliopsis andreniformis]|uniref:glucose dehydrogenase [FAD, quinone]-like n=1 Tax=Calliopsis andreniformis TaxID=337506 RepID=UPI003FCDACD0